MDEEGSARGSSADECLRALQANASALLERCGVVTRRDFEVQQRLLAQAMAKLEAAEAKLAAGAGRARSTARRRKAAPQQAEES